MSNIEKRSAAKLAAVVGRAKGTSSKAGRRELEDRKKRLRAKGSFVLLIDGSSSMSWTVASGDHKYKLLGRALQDLAERGAIPPGTRVVYFDDGAREIGAGTLMNLPFPSGGTNMTAAFELAAKFEPSRTLVISDGEPTSPDPMGAAKRLSGVIDTLFIGDESAAKAIAFMRELSNLGAGRYHHCDIARGAAGRQQLPSAIAGMLPPSR